MNLGKNLQFFLIFIVFLLVVVGIGKYFIDIIVKEEGIGTQQQTDLITVTEDRKISWEQLSNMIIDCKVEQVSQTHDLRVSVVTKDKLIFWAYEPQIDEALQLADRASQDCGEQIIQITE